MPRRPRFQVGVIGLGVIGSRVAAVLRHEGHQVYVWNRSPRREPCFLGSPNAVAESAKVLQVFVPDDDSVLGLIDLLGDSLTSEHTFICHATISPETTRKAADLVEQRGAKFLDAPFTGSRDAAENRQLTYYIGGDPNVLTRVRPILEVSSQHILHLGKVGEASLIKIATNIVSASQVQAVIEALALVAASQIPPSKFAEAMKLNGGASPLLGMKLPSIIGQEFDAHFTLKHMFKDMQHAIRSGERVGLQLPVTDVTRSLLFEGLKEGWGELDFSALARHYFEVADPVLEEKTDVTDQPESAPIEEPEIPDAATEEEKTEETPEADTEKPDEALTTAAPGEAEKTKTEVNDQEAATPSEKDPAGPESEAKSPAESPVQAKQKREKKAKRHWGRKRKEPLSAAKTNAETSPPEPDKSASPDSANSETSQPESAAEPNAAESNTAESTDPTPSDSNKSESTPSDPNKSKAKPSKSKQAKAKKAEFQKSASSREDKRDQTTAKDQPSEEPSDDDPSSKSEETATVAGKKKKSGGLRGFFGRE